MDRTEPVSNARVQVLWRPGCPYCSRLRRGLGRAGVATIDRDIWSDPAAAARVRQATGGDETVPTVLIGSTALVNPSVAQVRAALRAEFPGDPEPAGPTVRRPPSVSGLLWTAVVALVWVLLAWWRPTTTWHLAPVLLAAAWPWLMGQDVRAGDRRAISRIAAAGLAGIAVTVLATLGLAGVGLLRGPVLGGFAEVVTESLVLGALGGALAVAAGLARALRRAVRWSAWVGEHRIAVSDDVVVVEGNAYFPESAVEQGVLAATSTRSVCPWKGVAGYWTVRVDGAELHDAAWTYRRPLPFARRVKGRVAFGAGVRAHAHPRDERGSS